MVRLICLPVLLFAGVGAAAEPESLGLDGQSLQRIDAIVAEGLEQQKMPGAVVLVGRRAGNGYLKAFGYRQLKPERVPMTVDTVFDLASLTKPIATATSVMKLVEQGRINLDDPVARYLPDFGVHGKDEITIQQLLIHQGGLIPDNSIRDYQDGPAEAYRRIESLSLHCKPGSKFVYTDVGFIVLAKVVEEVTGENLHEFSQRHIFGPLGMTETTFLPSDDLRARAAVTQQREQRWMRGEVHDPRAYRLGGIAGHAGLFSTAEDLAEYARAMMGAGEFQPLSDETRKAMTASIPVSAGTRGLGWDKRSSFSSNRSELYSPQAFGHGGFTGTGIWIDPQQDLFVIFLSNRVHPDGKGSVNPLIRRIGTAAVSALAAPQPDKTKP